MFNNTDKPEIHFALLDMIEAIVDSKFDTFASIDPNPPPPPDKPN